MVLTTRNDKVFHIVIVGALTSTKASSLTRAHGVGLACLILLSMTFDTSNRRRQGIGVAIVIHWRTFQMQQIDENESLHYDLNSLGGYLYRYTFEVA